MWKNKNAKNKQNPQTGTSSLSQLCGRCLAQPAGPSAAKFSELAPPPACTQCPPSSPLPSRRDLRPSLRPSFRVACSRADQSSRPGSEVTTLSPGAGEGAPASPHPRQDRGDGHAHRSPPEGGCPRLSWSSVCAGCPRPPPLKLRSLTGIAQSLMPAPPTPTRICPAPKPSDMPGRTVQSHFCPREPPGFRPHRGTLRCSSVGRSDRRAAARPQPAERGRSCWSRWRARPAAGLASQLYRSLCLGALS